ncbi:MAG: nucleotidyl transferase AbiEii/AbiGii toxin family protein [Gemmatimonadales bacterium]|jgi:hypothetical protein|nr:nucleotidyl transferase AbiEii/AbiGii toxin family protein [Gemmatimonadales bacterium]
MTRTELRDALKAFQVEHGISSTRRVLDLYAVRQLLVRLQRTRHADRFKLKGGMYVGAVLEDYHRTTRDADLLDRGRADPDEIRAVFKEVVAVELDDDVSFNKLETRIATRDVDGYDGVKVEHSARVAGQFATASVDIGYGDAVVPDGEEIEVPPLFEGGDELIIPAYSVEAFLAEKTETVMSGFPGKTMKRLKDFYDIAVLIRSWSRSIRGETLVAAFRPTFERRKAAPDPSVFTDIRELVDEDALSWLVPELKEPPPPPEYPPRHSSSYT